ncbi:MAG TPA: SIMPL domain-containing protein [Burkholderiaceae bacterium]|nr:SIMPL domain-containing protein [Burkholderiaceae bacterium]
MIGRFALLMSLICCVANAFASQLPDYPFIHTTGRAFSLLPPDIGEVEFEIAGSGNDAEKTLLLVNARSAEILSILSGQDVRPEDIEGSDIQKKIRKLDVPDGSPAAEAIDVKRTFHIYVRDLTKWQQVVIPLLTMENIGNFSVSFDCKDRARINDDLIVAAAKDAQHNGANIANAFGKHLAGVVAVSEGKLKDVGVALGLVSHIENHYGGNDQRRTEPADFLIPQALPFSQSVDVIFKIK